MNASKKVPGFLQGPVSVLIWLVVIFSSITWFLIGLILVLPLSLPWPACRKTRNPLHFIAVCWARTILLFAPTWNLRVEGLENIDLKKNYVIVANHQSLVDIFVVLAALPIPFKFLAKQELFKLPFVGWHMSLAGYIPLERASRESGRKAAQHATQWLNKGVSVLFFPEGTRSLDGEIHPFKMGAFKIANQQDMEILPLVLDGTGEAIPKKTWKIENRTPLFLSVGKPVKMSSHAAEELEAVKTHIHDEMRKRLKKYRARS